ncbi:MAG TPA: ABC transporter permease [Anaerolineaceae bacterium]|nr:ABC transporter permease [Anaerolineaceae bacterium]HOV07147.1 ABC transporter permease [Anaerolineaceae bacterium]
MMKSLVRIVRLYLFQAWYSYRSLFAWSTPFSYMTSKFGYPLFSMMMFVFIGKFVGFTDPSYIVLGNILLMPITNGLYGISMTIGNERQFGALSYLLGSPAPRAPLFLGRALFHILDGFLTVCIALPIAMLFFDIQFKGVNLFLLVGCLILITIASTGLGLIMGTISLRSQDGWMFTNTLGQLLFLLIGVNFPIQQLPAFLQPVSTFLPMSRGIQAARMVVNGAGWSNVAGLLGGEVLVGLAYILIGYTLFRIVERASMSTGSLDSF